MSKPKLTIFKNEKYGQQIIKKDGTPVTYNGEPMMHCALNGKISLPEGLPAGDYDVAIYQNVSKKGTKYYSGNIKPTYKKPDAHNQAKANAYQSQPADEDDFLDKIPF